MATAFFCIARGRGEAEGIREELRGQGIAREDISLCFLDEHGAEGRSLARVEGYEKPPTHRLVATGHFEWGLKGPIKEAGPGSLTRVLCAMGMPREEARKYESRVLAGSILLSVFCGTELLAKRAKMTLQKAETAHLASVGRIERERAEA